MRRIDHIREQPHMRMEKESEQRVIETDLRGAKYGTVGTEQYLAELHQRAEELLRKTEQHEKKVKRSINTNQGLEKELLRFLRKKEFTLEIEVDPQISIEALKFLNKKKWVGIPVEEVEIKKSRSMLQYEKETGKSAIKEGKVTEEYKQWEREALERIKKKPEVKPEPPKPPVVEVLPVKEEEIRKKLNDMTVGELKQICKDNKVSGYSRLKKADLIDLIMESLPLEPLAEITGIKTPKEPVEKVVVEKKPPKEEIVDIPKGEPSGDWTKKQLIAYHKKYCAYENLKVGKADKLTKDHILALIRKAKRIDEGMKKLEKLDLELEKNLNEEQLEVVNNLDGNMLVLAGAGSGKTRTVTYAVAKLLKEGARPSEIVLVTFTRKASEEMVERTGELLGFEAPITAGTFHSIATRFYLKKFHNLLGIKSYKTLADDAFLKSIRFKVVKFVVMKRLIVEHAGINWTRGDYEELRRINIPYDERKKYENSFYKTHNQSVFWYAQNNFPEASILQQIFSAKHNLEISIEEVLERFDDYEEYREYADEIEIVYEQYERHKKSQIPQWIDFADMLVCWSKLLDKKEVKEYTKKRFKYFLIDEYQDTNIIQNDIIKKINDLGHTKLILAVGDDAQSIYAFRGANFENILRFEKEFSARKFKITFNYRSSPEILALANAVIENNINQEKKEMKPVNPPYRKPVLIESNDSSREAEAMISIVNECHGKGVPYEEIGILFSNFKRDEIKTVIDDLEERMVKGGIPYEKRGGWSFFERRHVKDVLYIFLFLEYPSDIRGHTWLVDIAKRYVEKLGEQGAGALHSTVIKHPYKSYHARDFIIEPMKFREEVEKKGMKWNEGFQNLAHFLKKVHDIKERNDSFGKALEELWNTKLKKLMQQSYRDDFKDREKDIELLIEKGKEYKTFLHFDRDIHVGFEDDPEKTDKLILSTIHKAKGLEWDVVLMPLLYEMHIPHYSAIRRESKDGDVSAMEEERRKFYVAITRPRKDLYLFGTNDSSIGKYGVSRTRFLQEVDQDLFELKPLEDFLED